MRTLYLDIFSGISGDMFLGALLDLGADFEGLKSSLKQLNVGGYHLHLSRRQQSHISGAKFDVVLDAHEHLTPTADHSAHNHTHHHAHAAHRTFQDIRQLIVESSLSDWVKERSVSVFRRVAEAEGKIHGLPMDEVHFHEVGAIDSIVDIVGACLVLEQLGQPRILASKVVEGTGWVDCAHGRFPVPTPATMEILRARGIPLEQCDEPHELVTPTGAALLAEFVESFGGLRGFTPREIGYGLGTRQNKHRPNVLRVLLGETAVDSATRDWETDRISILQTNLDDIPAEVLGHFMDQAFAQGALDVFHTPVQMKKNRPGVVITVLCPVDLADPLTELILRETTAFGVRETRCERRKLQRETVSVETLFGKVEIKLGRLNGEILQIAPEYRSCAELARKTGAPIRRVYNAAIKAYGAPPAEPRTRETP